ncbi:MAG TPA: DUF4314 domain-containing protein [Actinomycetota bacterium]
MSIHPQEPDPFAPDAVVEVVVEDPQEELYRGDRGTILVRDAIGDLHILWDSGDIDIWKVSDARTYLRVVTDPEQ